VFEWAGGSLLINSSSWDRYKRSLLGICCISLACGQAAWRCIHALRHANCKPDEMKKEGGVVTGTDSSGGMDRGKVKFPCFFFDEKCLWTSLISTDSCGCRDRASPRITCLVAGLKLFRMVRSIRKWTDRGWKDYTIYYLRR
jgi:hypothetical protein